MDVSHLHAFLPEASHGVAFSKSVLISTSTEISLWAWVWFPTFSAAMLSHAGKHTHIHTHIHTHTYTTHTHTHGDRRGWGEDTIVRGHVWNTHMHPPWIGIKSTDCLWPHDGLALKSCWTMCYVWIQHCLLLSVTAHMEEHTHTHTEGEIMLLGITGLNSTCNTTCEV